MSQTTLLHEHTVASRFILKIFAVIYLAITGLSD